MRLKERIEATQMKKCREADCNKLGPCHNCGITLAIQEVKTEIESVCNPLPCDRCDTECDVVNCPKLIEWMSEENMRNMILEGLR